MDFVQGQHITADYLLIDEHLDCIPIAKITKTGLGCSYPKQYVEKTKRDRHQKISSVERRIVNVDVYAIEVEKPHTFLISDRTYHKENGKPRLLLTHNGIPALDAGLSLAFGSSLASISLAQASATVGALSVIFGPVGLTLGVVTGVGIWGYRFFKNKDRK